MPYKMEEEQSPAKGLGQCENQVQSEDDEKIVGVTERIRVAEPKPNQSKNAATVKENKAKTGKEKCRRSRKGNALKNLVMQESAKLSKRTSFGGFQVTLRFRPQKKEKRM